MRRFLFYLVTLLIGIGIQIFCNRYLSFFGGSGPQVILLMVVALGFIQGPIMGEVMGFTWGLLIDSIGVSLFGMHTLLLSIAGYVSGKLRRRVASERPQAQMVIGLVSTLLYGLASFIIQSLFEEEAVRGIYWQLLLTAVLNVLLVAAVFWILERWVYLWRFQRERIS